MTIRKKLGRVTSNPLVLIASCFLIIGVMAWLVIAQETDSDNDGMYDNYEVFFGLDTNNAADASDNYDSDSLTNYDESVIWTDPNEGDTDRDGFSDGEDSNATSRVFIQWGQPFFTFGDAYDYTGPEWWLASYKSGGDWLTNAPFGWQGSPVVSRDGMVWIPGGTKSGVDPDSVSYYLVVSNFYMDQTEITRWEWQNVRSWAITHGYSDLPVGYGKAYNHPVYSNNWYDCVKWCNARSEMQGYTPAYYTTSAKTTVYRTGEIDLADNCVNWYGGYRLPTDAEWEYAGRGTFSGKRFPWWGANITHSLANYYSTTDYAYDTSPTRGYHPSYDSGAFPYTSPVGSFTAYGYGDGLYDMAGNIAEWTWNWYNYAKRSERGGHWKGKANLCRLTVKAGIYPSDSSNYLGFRTILSKNKFEELIIEVDRALLTNNVVLSMDFLDRTNSSLYIALANTNHVWVATNLFGNLISGSGCVTNFTGDIPFTNYPTAAEIHIWCDLGVATVYTNRLYIDQDHDELDQDMEFQYGTSDTNTDSDADGLSDYDEVFFHNTNPTNSDTDGDDLWDGAEISTHLTDPLDEDTDNDQMPDGWEFAHSFNPTNPSDASLDRDVDGISNVDEWRRDTDPDDPQDFNIVLYVDAETGNDLNRGISPTATDSTGPKRTISAALDASFNGDIVQAAQGEYTGGTATWDLTNKTIHLVPQGTVIVK